MSQKLTDRTALAETPASGDLVHIVDVSDTTDSASGTSKKITTANLLGGTQPLDADLTTLASSFTSASAASAASLALHEDTDNGTNKVTLIAPASIASDKTITLPDATDTLVGKDTTDTLTNKTLTSPVLTTPKITTSINDANGNEVIKTPATASAVNEITVTNAATGGVPEVSASGGDTDVWQAYTGKGAGKVEVELPYGSADATSTSSSGAYTDVTGCSFSLTIKKTSHVQVFFGGSIQNNTAARHVDLRILRASSDLKTSNCHVTNSGTGCNASIALVDQSLAAGTYTYKLQVAPGNGADTVVCNSGRLWAVPVIA